MIFVSILLFVVVIKLTNFFSISIDFIKGSIKNFGYKKNIVGTWKQINNEEEDKYFYFAEIDDAITIYVYDKSLERTNVYFAGDFNNKIDINKQYEINSNNFSKITNDIKNASHIFKKQIIYRNRMLNFEGDYNGEYRDVVLQKTENSNLPLIKYLGKRISSNDFNNKIEICGKIIFYPDYFDKIEENSKIDILKNIKNEKIEKEEMLNNTYYVVYPSDDNSYAEMFFGSYSNANIKTIDDLRKVVEQSEKNNSKEYILLETKEFKINETDAIMQIFYTYYDDLSDKTNETLKSIAYETWIDVKERNEILDIGISYGYDDLSNNDYIEDYKKVLNNIINMK